MAETRMNVTLISHTQLSGDYLKELPDEIYASVGNSISDGQAVALSAVRTCYSPGKPSEIVLNEGEKYFGSAATDGEGGTEADRLLRMIVRSKHTSTLEHITFNFAVEGVSRALLAQLTRHRVGFSFSVQSQRYVKFGSGDRSGGFDYVVPETVATAGNISQDTTVKEAFEDFMREIQGFYDFLRTKGVPAEDARAVLPQASACNLVLTSNLRALLDFYSKRRSGRGGQLEITQLAEELRKAVTAVEPWTDAFFEGV